MRIRAAIVREPSEPFIIEEVDIDKPRVDEVLVRNVATGICHTDITVRGDPPATPVVLGHEGAGIVLEVGERVTKVQPGDHVVLSFLSCGQCTSCVRGHPYYCHALFPLNFNGTRPDGSSPLSQNGEVVLGSFFGQSSFATHSIASERNVVKVSKEDPLEVLGPLGCGIQTGAGAVINALRPRAGSSIAVFGSGSVGLSAVMAAVVVGCATIIGVDIRANRLELAQSLGATHTINAREEDPVEAIQRITNGGVEYAFEAAGLPSVSCQAVASLAPMGICGLLSSHNLEISFGLGRRVHNIVEGESIPDVFVPQMIELYRQGRFPFDRLMRFYSFSEINKAVEDAEQGDTIKPVLRMPDE